MLRRARNLSSLRLPQTQLSSPGKARMTGLSESSRPLRTLLITYPLYPTSLVDDLRKVFPVVHNYPMKAGNDYAGLDRPEPPEEVYKEAEVLLCFSLPKSLQNWEQTPNLRLLECVGAGTAHITSSDYYKSIPAESPLILANSTGIHVPSISEHVLMTTLALNHKLQQVTDVGRNEKRWGQPNEFDKSTMFIRELRGMTIGILGYGHLGRECARLFTAFGAKIRACTRTGLPTASHGFLLPGTGDPKGDLPEKWYKSGEKESLGDFLAGVDVLVNCLPGGDANRHVIGREALTRMKNDALYVNIGRGETTDSQALLEALSSKDESERGNGKLKIRGAAIDVTDPEPLPDGHPLFSLNNLILTPHVSWASEVNFVRAVELLILNKKRIDEGLGALNALRGKGEFD